MVKGIQSKPARRMNKEQTVSIMHIRSDPIHIHTVVNNRFGVLLIFLLN